MGYRIEKDSMGEIQVPDNALYGAQTQRAINNFKISSLSMPTDFIDTIIQIKKAAAIANRDLGLLDKEIAKSIIDSCDELIKNKRPEQFPIDVFQTGSGTSTNMNVNEVIANLASQRCDQKVGANDHVNMSQSSNDVIPTAIHVSSALAVENSLKPALLKLLTTLNNRAEELKDSVKTGRTHLMDAMPITFGQEISGWASQIKLALERIKDCQPRLQKVAQGGTAVGTGINSHPKFAAIFAEQLTKNISINITKSDNFFAALSSQDTIVELSGQLKALAVAFIKISNDLRLMNSGPLAGIGDIELVALQPGSSIMPGKVNPVVPEALMMVGAQVIGNDVTISMSGALGNFQLNVMLPVIGYNILQSINILANGADALNHLSIKDFKPKMKNVEKALSLNPILVTALNPIIGYQKAATIAKQAYRESRPIIDVALENTDLSRSELERLLDPLKLTKGGIAS